MKSVAVEQLTVDQAKEQHELLEVHRSSLVEKRMSLDRKAEQLERESGRAYLRGDRSVIEQSVALEVELKGIERALAVLDDDVKEALAEIERAKVREIRAEIAAKQRELDALNRKTEALLGQLSTLENVEYTHSILSSQPMKGKWFAPQSGYGPPIPYHGVLELEAQHPMHGLPFYLPKSRALILEIEKLEADARAIEQKIPPPKANDAAEREQS
jgi:hypothetical protein